MTEKLINRASQMISFGVPLVEIVARFVNEGIDVPSAHNAARAGELMAKYGPYN